MIFFFYLNFALSERRYHNPLKMDGRDAVGRGFDDFDNQNDNFDNFDTVDERSLRRARHSQRHFIKPKHNEEIYDPLPDTVPFQHSHEEQPGKRVCDSGYISGPIIDKRGCWKCAEICDTFSSFILFHV